MKEKEVSACKIKYFKYMSKALNVQQLSTAVDTIKAFDKKLLAAGSESVAEKRGI